MEQKEKTPLGEIQKKLVAARVRFKTKTGNSRDRTWRHKRTGDYYTVEVITVRKGDLTVLVSYSPLIHPNVIFTAPMDEFLESMSQVSR